VTWARADGSIRLRAIARDDRMGPAVTVTEPGDDGHDVVAVPRRDGSTTVAWSDRTSAQTAVVTARRVSAAGAEPGAKLAMREYAVVRRLPGATLIEFAPLTGRMHQLRVQAAWRGHPVLGDVTYGSARPFGPPAELPRDRVIALHARRLTLTHPSTKQEMTLEAPLPGYWSDAGVAPDGGPA
jgi:hypothetical protein